MTLFATYVYLFALALRVSSSIIGTVKDSLASHCGESDAFHEQTGKCFRLGIECDGLMRFYDSGDGFGDCDCDDSLGEKLIGYWRPYNRCYYLYTQGPCRQDEWIVIDGGTNSTKCQLNPCPRIPITAKWDIDTNFWFYRFGKCWKTNTRAFCADDEIFRTWFDASGRDNTDFGICVCNNAVRLTFGRQSYTYLPCLPGYSHMPGHRKCKRIQLDLARADSPDD